MRSVTSFSELETQFLQPLIAERAIRLEERPLDGMQRWDLTNGTLSSAFFNVTGTHVSLEPKTAFAPPHEWDQPLYHQKPGRLALFIDEERHILVQALFEPGNVGRGYQQSGLVLVNGCKFSPENLNTQRSLGRILPLSDLIDHPQAKQRFFHEAPGDGGRADKQNQHYLIELPRTILEEAVDNLPAVQKDFYTLIPLSVLKECYTQALANEHLRDLASMLLFLT